MNRIFKYPIAGERSHFTLSMPRGAEVLALQMQRGRFGVSSPTIWAGVDDAAPLEARAFAVVGTGHEVPDGYRYFGTFIDGDFVGHLFERPSA